jgi:hypothetical protein
MQFWLKFLKKEKILTKIYAYNNMPGKEFEMNVYRLGVAAILVFCLFNGCQTSAGNKTNGQVQQNNSFEMAVLSASEYLASRIPENGRIAIVKIDTRKRISNYIIEKMNQHLVNDNRFVVIEDSQNCT